METIITHAIANEGTITLKYDSNDRHVQPLVLGVTRNGHKALLCYKIDTVDGVPALSIRLYYVERVSDVALKGDVVAFSNKIDYFLSRFFRKPPVACIALREAV